MPRKDALSRKLSDLPHKPGIYLMKDRFGTVIYVGKARDLRRRVTQYFHPSRRMAWDPKLRALIDAIHEFDIHLVRNEPEAILLEGKLIKEFRPRYNVSFRDDKRFLLVKVNLSDPIPRFTLTRLQTDDGARYFGPFASSSAVRRTLNLVRTRFHLRGCRSLLPTEADYKHCLYAHLKVCTAPCIENVSVRDYRQQVIAACDFLEGHCEEMIDELESEMKQAAKDLDFEKAAELRDLLSDLRRTTRKIKPFKRVPYTLPLADDPEAALMDLSTSLQLPVSPTVIDGFDISNISGTFAVASLVRFSRGRPDRANYRRFRIKTVQGQDDFASIAEAVRRRYQRLLDRGEGHCSPDAKSLQINLPDLILIDGGKGQLSAAYGELRKLGLKDIPVIGLAKQFEEIYRPHQSAPLRLDRDSRALKLLQRVRDESHRFANTYSAQLRLKKISESLLDEFPGIGRERKAVLLQHFGSIHRLQEATTEAIAELPGFGPGTASRLKAFLEARVGGRPAPGASATREASH